MKRDRFRWALEVLPIQPNDRVLEVGCGHGVALSLVGARLSAGHVLGIDRSAKMTALAKKRNAALVRAGRVAVRTGALAEVELGHDPFDLTFAIDVALFARDADRELARLRTAIRSGGAMYLFYESPSAAHVEGFATGATANLERHGFGVRRVTDERDAVCLAALAPG